MARHSNVPKDQHAELVLAVLRGTEKLEMLARRHQVSSNTLRRWRVESSSRLANSPADAVTEPSPP